MVDGTWNYCSGIPYATHFVGNVILRENGTARGLIFVIPRAQLTVLPDWGGDATLGMRASGSNSVKIDKVFVPEHLVIPAKPALLRSLSGAVLKVPLAAATASLLRVRWKRPP